MWQQEPPPPQYFGPYQVLDVIGTGGMGTVYRARDTRLHREVALKVLRRNLSVSRARDRFLREARAVSSLSHPNICTLFDIGEQDGDPFLVMELLRGEALKERIQRGPLPAEEIQQIAFGAASALRSAHRRGIIHRDIKPANLFLVNDDRGATHLRILDFGLAKITTDAAVLDASEQITRYGATVGTVEYMSPEQARGEVVDVRSDLFSLGAVLYEAATGKVPFQGSTSAVVFSELLNAEPVPPREANLAVPASLNRIIQRLLTKDRQKRVQSAAELLQLLAKDAAGQSERYLSRSEMVPRRAIQSCAPPDALMEQRAAAGGPPSADPRSSDGDLSDPVARSGERRHQALAVSTRPIARYVLVDDPVIEIMGANGPAAASTASLDRVQMVAILIAALLMAGSMLLVAHART